MRRISPMVFIFCFSFTHAAKALGEKKPIPPWEDKVVYAVVFGSLGAENNG